LGIKEKITKRIREEEAGEREGDEWISLVNGR